MKDSIAKKSLGQHWLKDKTSIDSIIKAAKIEQHDIILEIGPGHGDLTKKLATASKQVYAVEFDQELIAPLRKQFSDSNVEIIQNDIRKYDLTKLPSDYIVVANIPYYLTNILIRTLLASSNPPHKICLLVQKEVAQRIAAGPGQMSLLALSVQLFGQVTLGPIIVAQKFKPPPKVDSQVVIIEQDQLYPDEIIESVMKLAKIGFAAKRKTLLNNLSAGFKLDKKTTLDWLINSGLDEITRAQELAIEQWQQLLTNKPKA